MVKVTIRVKQMTDPDDGNFWVVTSCNVPTGPNTNKPLSSGDQYRSKDEAIDEMKRRARDLLVLRSMYTSDEDIVWDIRETSAD